MNPREAAPRAHHIPLGLYVHIPWCVRKCPYCDFNSHARPEALPEQAYVAALLADLDAELASGSLVRRPIQSVFIGGGTPSLFSGRAIGTLLEGLAQRLDLAPDVEITLEANPGASEAARFADYRAAGVNRLSIGMQSLDDDALRALGRIHDAAQARRAVRQARSAGFDNLNLDLMYGLPGQTLQQASADLRALLAEEPEHVSWYQLTLEPNTLFHARPPALPDEDQIAAMMDAGLEMLARAGYEQYEISAHARPGRQARHNRNYWEFGDYLGIGAGAHAKLTDASGRILRHARLRGPKDYLAAAGSAISSERVLAETDLPIEFLLNALRLLRGVPAAWFTERTGLPLARIAVALRQARDLGLLEADDARIAPTRLGSRFLNDLLALFE